MIIKIAASPRRKSSSRQCDDLVVLAVVEIAIDASSDKHLKDTAESFRSERIEFHQLANLS